MWSTQRKALGRANFWKSIKSLKADAMKRCTIMSAAVMLRPTKNILIARCLFKCAIMSSAESLCASSIKDSISKRSFELWPAKSTSSR